MRPSQSQCLGDARGGGAPVGDQPIVSHENARLVPRGSFGGEEMFEPEQLRVLRFHAVACHKRSHDFRRMPHDEHAARHAPQPREQRQPERKQTAEPGVFEPPEAGTTEPRLKLLARLYQQSAGVAVPPVFIEFG